MFGSLRDRQILSTHSFVGTLNVYTYTIDKVCRTSFSLATPTVLFTVESLGPVQSIDRIAKHWNFVRLPTTAQRFLHASGPSAFEDRLVRLAATEQKFGTICQPFDVDLPWKCLSPCQEPWCEDHVKLHMLHRVLLLCCVWYKYSDHSAMYNDIFLHALHLHETNPVSYSVMPVSKTASLFTLTLHWYHMFRASPGSPGVIQLISGNPNLNQWNQSRVLKP